MTLFLFLLTKAALAFLPTALFVALRPLFPFQQAQYTQVFALKHAPFCTLFARLGSTNKSAISFLFSYYLTLVLSFSLFLRSLCFRRPVFCSVFLSPQSPWQKLFSLYFCTIRLQWVPGHSFLILHCSATDSLLQSNH